MHHVIVLDNLAQQGIDLLEAADSIQFDVRTNLSGRQLQSALLEYDGAICRSGVNITADVLEGNNRLRAIVRAGVGTDNIDKQAATRRGIVVMNTPSGNTTSTAEHAFTLMLALSRNVHSACQSLIEGRWERKKYMGSQLADKTLGIVGLGRIGQEVAIRALAFQMRVVGYDPFLAKDRAAELGIELVEDHMEMLPRIDYLTVHTPLTSETKGLIGQAELEMIKPGARLINCARGGIYDEQALVKGLKSGKLAGVALDVFLEEPCTDSPLFGMPDVVCTPHLGASTEEAQTQVAVEAVRLLTNYFNSGEIRHAVNVASVDPQTLEKMRGHLDVAYRLGLALAQLHRGSPSRCCLNYRGDVAEKNTRLLSAAFCAGLLERAMTEDVNIVNSEVLLRDRGIELVAERNTEMGPFSSSITASLVTDQKTYTVGGTLFGNEMPRLFRVGQYQLEAYLDGYLFVFTHNDVPGIIGNVGTVFGKHDINIAQMSVGREQPGGEAIGVINLDSAPTEEAVDEVLQNLDITSARCIELPCRGKLPVWLH